MTTPVIRPASASPADLPGPPPLDGLPVAVSLASALTDRVERYLEAELGWQVVGSDDATLPPRIVIVDVTAQLPGDLTTVLLATRTDRLETVAAAVGRLRPDEVVVWPDDRGHLAAAVAGLVTRPSRPAATTTLLCVGGAAGGVGTTSVALALAALSAWDGAAVLVVTRPPTPLPGRPHSVAVLSSDRVLDAARPVAGVPGLRHLTVAHAPDGDRDGRVDVAARSTTIGAVVVDVGVEHDVDVLVVRRDRAGLAAIEVTVAPVIVVQDDGPIPLAVLQRGAGGRRAIVVPRSIRVARADAAGRGPAAYPGAWLRRLRPVVATARGPTRPARPT